MIWTFQWTSRILLSLFLSDYLKTETKIKFWKYEILFHSWTTRWGQGWTYREKKSRSRLNTEWMGKNCLRFSPIFCLSVCLFSAVYTFTRFFFIYFQYIFYIIWNLDKHSFDFILFFRMKIYWSNRIFNNNNNNS